MSEVKATSTEVKEYVLLPHHHPTAPIFMQVGPSEMVRIDTLSKWMPYLQYTIVTPEGKSRTARFKIGANSIWLDEQIANGIPANAKFTQRERDLMKFRYGRLRTGIPIAKEFLDNSPQMKGFEGTSVDNIKPSFEAYSKATQQKELNSSFKTMLKAGNIIAKYNLKQAQEMLIRIQGSFVPVPDNVEECQNELAELVDSNPDALKEVLKSEKDRTADDETNLMIGKLVHSGILSFEHEAGAISKKFGEEWKTVKEIGGEDPEERQRLFVEFLNSDAGQALLSDLKNDLRKVEGVKTAP